MNVTAIAPAFEGLRDPIGVIRDLHACLPACTEAALVDRVRGKPFEVTTLRRDVTTDGRHAVVAFTDDWTEDAARRDFTMNALSADPDGRVHDPFDGVADLAAGRVRFVGEARARIREDVLRILRFFRFTARFAQAPDPVGLEACVARANDLMALSRERIADEWWRPRTNGRTMPANIVPPVRDYYRVEDNDGVRFWLFRDGRQNSARWFLHGFCA